MDALVTGEDGKIRCGWQPKNEAVRLYHDTEYGRPSDDERAIFEKFCLETLAAGLNFGTILRRRDLLREAFQGFEIDRVAKFNEKSIDRLMNTDGIFGSEAKLRACVGNARAAQAMRDADDGLPKFLWSFEPSSEERPETMTLDWLLANPANSSSQRMAKALKDRGWKWVGPIICYGVFQGLGLVNDHFDGCDFRAACDAAREAFTPPK